MFELEENLPVALCAFVTNSISSSSFFFSVEYSLRDVTSKLEAEDLSPCQASQSFSLTCLQRYSLKQDVGVRITSRVINHSS